MNVKPFLVLVILVAIGTTSCHKTYTCECEYPDNNVPPKKYQKSIIDLRRKNAEKECKEISNPPSATTGASPYYRNCKLL